jgi:hypothetical protein
MTRAAPEDVLSGLTWHGSESGLGAVLYPAQGAKVISPALDRKICRSLKRSARILAFRIYLRLFFLDIRKAFIEVRYYRGKVSRILSRLLLHMFNKGRHRKSSRPSNVG